MYGVTKSRPAVSEKSPQTFSHELISNFGWYKEIFGVAHTYTSIDVINDSERGFFVDRDTHALKVFYLVIDVPTV
jgi:hypothetical protein